MTQKIKIDKKHQRGGYSSKDIEDVEFVDTGKKQTVTVRFRNEEDFQKFCELYGRRIAMSEKVVEYPPRNSLAAMFDI